MSAAGWIVMLLSVASISLLFGWCIVKVLRTPGASEHGPPCAPTASNEVCRTRPARPASSGDRAWLEPPAWSCEAATTPTASVSEAATHSAIRRRRKEEALRRVVWVGLGMVIPRSPG